MLSQARLPLGLHHNGTAYEPALGPVLVPDQNVYCKRCISLFIATKLCWTDMPNQSHRDLDNTPSWHFFLNDVRINYCSKNSFHLGHFISHPSCIELIVWSIAIFQGGPSGKARTPRKQIKYWFFIIIILYIMDHHSKLMSILFSYHCT